ncbi:MAG: hypothetical protein AMS18_11825 [Gemmatimonas sp. SG8_17]|nr:MAG: hypothetical protein AMS18_11825 [Gemmatimonas sp. SG8_17]
MSRVDYARIDEGVLKDAQRSLPPVRGRNDTQQVMALRSREALLFVNTTQAELRGVQVDPEEVRPVGQRRICLLVADSAVLAVLELNGGTQTRSAEQLRIGSATLYRKLKKYGLIGQSPNRRNK